MPRQVHIIVEGDRRGRKGRKGVKGDICTRARGKIHTSLGGWLCAWLIHGFDCVSAMFCLFMFALKFG